MIVILNGPLGVGKSTLAEALSESIDACVMLDGDQLIAANPPAPDAQEHLHATIKVMVEHHRRFGYRHFVIDHFWSEPAALKDLVARLRGGDARVHCFLLTLSEEENLARIARRASGRANDDTAFELRTNREEREALAKAKGDELGEPFDITAPVPELVRRLQERLGISGDG